MNYWTADIHQCWTLMSCTSRHLEMVLKTTIWKETAVASGIFSETYFHCFFGPCAPIVSTTSFERHDLVSVISDPVESVVCLGTRSSSPCRPVRSGPRCALDVVDKSLCLTSFHSMAQVTRKLSIHPYVVHVCVCVHLLMLP